VVVEVVDILLVAAVAAGIPAVAEAILLVAIGKLPTGESCKQRLEEDD
jgi:hypothetical protein